MRSILTLGLITLALSFCGLSDKLKQMSGGTSGNTTTSNSNSGSGTTPSTSGTTVETPKPTSEQQAIMNDAVETKWDEQGIQWKLPKNWKKSSVSKEQFFYMSPDVASLIVSISVMPDSFPMDVSMKAYFDQALQKMKNGDYESVRMLEIDGIQGVEFTEAPPAGKDDPRRHQWIAFRTYLGQKQQVNVMTATKGSNFEKHKDDFSAILYSAKFTK